MRALNPPDVVTGRHPVGVKLHRCIQQVTELHPLIAENTRDRSHAFGVPVGKVLHHAVLKPLLVVEHVVRDAKMVGHATRVVHVLACAARLRAGFADSPAVQVERNAHDFVSRFMQQRRHDRAVNATGHCDDDAGAAVHAACPLGDFSAVRRL